MLDLIKLQLFVVPFYIENKMYIYQWLNITTIQGHTRPHKAVGSKYTLESFSSDYEYEFSHFRAKTRHIAYAISQSQQKVVAVAQFSTKFLANLVVLPTSYGEFIFLCFCDF